ncbi:MAG: Fic family protein [Coriobacteriales bacterium]|jgi:fido (protein-threonine AMPylation protein)|nr:Fic family protein [Coriobacteriales bacterium]
MYREEIPYMKSDESDSTAEERRGYWNMAIGLQAVDGIKPSVYLLNLAERSMSGELTYPEVERLLTQYYTNQQSDSFEDAREADFASSRIAHILASASFSLDAATLQDYHRMIFSEIRQDAGVWKTDDWIKHEPILYGDTVIYGSKDRVLKDLSTVFEHEKNTPYLQMDKTYVINRLSSLTSDIWRIHPFNEGNTRATAVFVSKYIRALGFTVDNAPFKENSKYFRDALVRDNYQNLPSEVSRESMYIERFFDNLLYGGTHVLDSEDLMVHQLSDSPSAHRLLKGTHP